MFFDSIAFPSLFWGIRTQTDHRVSTPCWSHKHLFQQQPSFPRRSPIQVLTKLNWSWAAGWYGHHEMAPWNYKALKHQELNFKESPLISLTEISQPQDSHMLSTIQPTQVHHPLDKHHHKLECYSALNREYTMASYRSTVTDVKLKKTLTMYRLSEHSLAIETGWRRQTWLSRVERICSNRSLGKIETELHFLTECPKYLNTRGQNQSYISPI